MKKSFSRKNMWESCPQGVRSMIGWVLHAFPPRFLLGRSYRRWGRFVHEAQGWSAEETRTYQLESVKRICTLAYEKTEFYRKCFAAVGFHPHDIKAPEDIDGLPIIDKETLRRHLEEMCAKPPDHPSVDYISTGGSSGTPLWFYIGRERSSIEYAHLIASWRRVGYELGMSVAVLRGRLVRPGSDGLRHEYDPILRHHYYSNFHTTDDDLAGYLKHMATIGRFFLHAYPSSAMALVRHLQRTGTKRPANIQGVLLESEMVFPDQRRAIEETFGCRVFSSYGHSEKLVLAAECEKCADYHVWPTYGYCELLGEDGRPVKIPGQRGEIVGTGFINTVVPFIRYRTGDYAIYVGEKCQSCGREQTIIRSVEGRWPSGYLVAVNGSCISMTAMNVHDDTFARVRQFQFYQDTPGAAVLRVVPADGFDESDNRMILGSIDRRLGRRLSVAIQIVDEIPLTSRGKVMYVDQRIPLDAPCRAGSTQ